MAQLSEEKSVEVSGPIRRKPIRARTALDTTTRRRLTRTERSPCPSKKKMGHTQLFRASDDILKWTPPNVCHAREGNITLNLGFPGEFAQRRMRWSVSRVGRIRGIN